MFEQAEEIAPNWAPPYVGLATYFTALPFYSDVPPAEVLPKGPRSPLHAEIDGPIRRLSVELPPHLRRTSD